jgi:eukaryotic-like serine/threonine-protein kinase
MELEPGTRIGDRYVVRKRGWATGAGAVWFAYDEVLERQVAVETFPDADPADVARAVARTAQITHPGLCQIYDMITEPPGIVFEHAPAGRLADRKDGALRPSQAASLCAQLASAIDALHQHGIAHGAIGPSSVLFDEEGRPKLTPSGVSDQLGAAATPDAYRPPAPGTGPEERDRYSLAAVAYRAFTGRDPGPDAPPARSAKRGVPATVDALLSRALARDPNLWPELDEFRRVMQPIASAEPAERGPGFFRQEASWLVPVLLVIAAAGAAIYFGVQKLTQPNAGERSPAPQASAAVYPVAAVEDFDPPPGNGEEHADEVGNAIDGKDTSVWRTVGYRTANLGGSKKGVGLVFDLGEARMVGRIEVGTPIPGWKAEWRRADSKGTRADDYTVAATFTATGEPVTIGKPVAARYWLLWITELVDSGTGGDFRFQAQVTDVAFFPR